MTVQDYVDNYVDAMADAVVARDRGEAEYQAYCDLKLGIGAAADQVVAAVTVRTITHDD